GIIRNIKKRQQVSKGAEGMPTYEFWCPKCKKVFEVKRPIADFDKLADCPDCNTGGQRLVSNFASKIGYNLQVPKSPFREKK
ncbi:MAG: zinc ribbon domain-containing protein, partial [Dehalococcoidia bacterium]|nr:zinc ribbon domain-containing protein [Dehalococcoidia bacterium]